mgnify:CR=1 FL=1
MLAESETVNCSGVANWYGRPFHCSDHKGHGAISLHGGFKDPESSGIYVGFIAGVLGANPARADELIAKMLPLPDADQWIAVRAIAYSGLPDWRSLLRQREAEEKAGK